MIKFQDEESNLSVIRKILKALKKKESIPSLIQKIQEWVDNKKPLETELERLATKARSGDNKAVKELISALAKMNDGR